MTELQRGSVVRYAERGDYTGKPRPGVIVQHSVSLDEAPSITLCGITTTIVPEALSRVAVQPSSRNGLNAASFVMVDKIATIRRDRLRETIGQLSADDLDLVDEALRAWLDL